VAIDRQRRIADSSVSRRKLRQLSPMRFFVRIAEHAEAARLPGRDLDRRQPAVTPASGIEAQFELAAEHAEYAEDEDRGSLRIRMVE
jgi:hypothetical protein